VTLLDLLVVAVVAASVAAGFVAGFARVGIGFLAAVFGVLFGFWFYGVPAAWVHKSVNSVTASNLIAFFLIFFAFLFAGALIGMAIAKFFRWTGLTWLDRLMGALFGLVRGALIVVAVVAVLMAFVTRPMPNWMVDSKSLPYAIDASHAISQAAPAGIKNAFRDSMLEIRQAWVEQLRKARKELEPGRREGNKDEKTGVEKPNETARPSLAPRPKQAKKKSQE
jgi:membrane protein required for colicin V production